MAKNITITRKDSVVTINPTQVQSITVPNDETHSGFIIDKRNQHECSHDEAVAAVEVLNEINSRL